MNALPADNKISHYDLCKLTAEWSIKKNNHLSFFEYQSYACNEFPDVLSFHSYGYTTLYEIKVSRSDFKADSKKDSRRYLRDEKVFIPGYGAERTKPNPEWPDKGPYNIKYKCWYSSVTKIIKQQPHLGRFRFYVCPSGLIKPSEVKLFGLIWFKNGKFYVKKNSEEFRYNLRAERNLLIHALRAKMQYEGGNVLVKPYTRGDE